VGAFALGALPADAGPREDSEAQMRHLHSWWLVIWEGFIIGSAIVFLQGHWYRALGFVPWSFLLLAIAFSALAIWPVAAWGLILSGVAFAFAYTPLVVAFIVNVPPRQQFAGAFLLHVAILIAVPLALMLLALLFRKASATPVHVLLAVAAGL